MAQKLSVARIWSLTSWLSGKQSKFQSYSTNVHNKYNHHGNKELVYTSPVFQENLHCVQKRPKIKYSKILKSDLQAMWQEMEFEVLSPPG